MFKKIFFYGKFFVLCLLFWLLLSYSRDPSLLIVGFVVSAILSLASYYFDFFSRDDFDISILNIIKYCVLLLINVFRSTLEMAKMTLSVDYAQKTAIHKITVHAKLKKYQKIMIANLITMTPGTFVISIYGNDFLVHFMDKEQIQNVTNLCYDVIKKD